MDRFGVTILDAGVSSIDWDGYRFVAVGPTDGAGEAIYISYNGINWFPTETDSIEDSRMVRYINERRHHVEFPGKKTLIFSLLDNAYGVSLNSSQTWAETFTNNILTSVNCAATNGRIWIVGGFSADNGYAYTFVEPNTFPNIWIAGGNAAFSQMNGIHWTGSRWVGGDNIGTIHTSDDGIIWIQRGSFTTRANCFAGNDSILVAGGIGVVRNLQYSTDGGLTWTDCPDNPINSQVTGLAWSGSMFVAVGTGDFQVAYSQDGITWTGSVVTLFAQTIVDVKANSYMFVAAGTDTVTGCGLAYSYDGINWITIDAIVFPTARKIAWDGTRWMVTGNTGEGGGVAYSQDPSGDWTIIATTINPNAIASNWDVSVSRIEPIVIAGGVASDGESSSLSSLAWAYGGTDWKGTGIVPLGDVYGFGYNGDYYLAGGENGMASSVDGKVWETVTTFTGVPYCFLWTGTYWYVGGVDDLGSPEIWRSLDLVTWTPLGTALTIAVYGLAWNGARYVAVGGGNPGIEYSTDGITFGPALNGFTIEGHAVIFTGSVFVAGGSGANVIFTSTDGNSWTATSVGGDIFTNVYTLCYNGKTIMAGGSGADVLAYSNDRGATWAASTVTPTGAVTINSVCWNGRMFICAGDGTTRIGISNEGIYWFDVPEATSIFQISATAIFSNPRIATLPIIPNRERVRIGDRITVATNKTRNNLLLEGSARLTEIPDVV